MKLITLFGAHRRSGQGVGQWQRGVKHITVVLQAPRSMSDCRCSCRTPTTGMGKYLHIHYIYSYVFIFIHISLYFV